jgi:Cys-tRNA(Pro)/Cys-tRNA(Cys) deacylase
MQKYSDKLGQFALENAIQAEFLTFEKSCHSVAEAAATANAVAEDFVKNICLISPDGELIVAILKGEDRLDLVKVSHHLSTKKPRMATSEEILERTGYPCGGTPSFGFKANFLIDVNVVLKDFVFTGGGDEMTLVKIMAKDILLANHGRLVDVHK